MDSGPNVFRDLFHAAPDAAVVVNDAGRIVLVNHRAETLFGYSHAELVGQEVELLVPERFRRSHVDHRSSFAKAPKVRPMGSGIALLGRRRDGTDFPLEISLSPLPTPQGMLTCASIRDITERKKNEDRIHRIQGHLLSAVESIQGAFGIFDARNRLVLCNSTFRRILGSDVEEEIVGQTFEKLLDANLTAGTFDLGTDTAEQFRNALGAYHRSPTGALDLRTRDGHSLRIVERRTAEGGTVATLWDITDDVAHEEELRRARSAAEAASTAKSEFLASMSHELRTPLNAILGFAQLLQRDKKEPLSERHRERIGHVVRGGEHLLHLIDDVLDLSRIEAGRVSVLPERVAIAEILREVEGTLRPMAERADIALTVDTGSASLPEVIADKIRFSQVLMNFGSNAVKYGRRGGKATFRARVREGVVRISVHDNGLGIPADKQHTLFQPFQRAGQETGSIEGTGIGLAITKRLSELMGGAVGFQSVEGEGSEFWIELPIHDADLPARALELGHPTPLPQLHSPTSPRILVVYIEDNPSSIAFMQGLLEDFDRVELATAPTAEIGIEIVRARRPHVVIMDIHLPGMTGVEAAQRLKAWPETRNIPIIALSAAAMVGDAESVRRAGFYRYLTKPVQVDELTRTLEEVLR